MYNGFVYWQAGIVSISPLADITSEQFMNMIRVNSLSLVLSSLCWAYELLMGTTDASLP